MSEIAVFGLGRLGLPWALLADRSGHSVRGIDHDADRVAAINDRRFPTAEPGVAELLADPDCGLTATTSPSAGLAGAEISFVAVPTPSRPDGAFSGAVVMEVVDHILTSAAVLAGAPHLLIISSTLSPGTMEGEVIPEIDRRCDESQRPAIAYYPEFHALGSLLHDLRHPRIAVVGAEDRHTALRVQNLIASISAPGTASPMLMGFTEAEIAKVGLNGMLALRIAYANLLGEVCTSFPGVDSGLVCSAIELDPRVGNGFFRPGPPPGGPCLPRDVPALRNAVVNAGAEDDLLAAVDRSTEAGFERLLNRVRTAVRPGETIGLVGLAFKDGVTEVEGSVGLELARRLTESGWPVLLFDPAVDSDDLQEFNWAPEPVDLVDRATAIVIMSRSSDTVSEVANEIEDSADPPLLIDAWN